MDAKIVRAYMRRVDAGMDVLNADMQAAHNVQRAIPTPILLDWINVYSKWKAFVATAFPAAGAGSTDASVFGQIVAEEKNLHTWQRIFAEQVSAALGRPAQAQPYARLEDSPAPPAAFELPKVKVETGIAPFAGGVAAAGAAMVAGRHFLTKRKGARS